jgi:hypothetical protein
MSKIVYNAINDKMKDVNGKVIVTRNICSSTFDDSTDTKDKPPDIKYKYNTFKKSFTGAVCDDKEQFDQTKFTTFYTDVVGMVC